MNKRDVHTSIPGSYYDYAKKHHLNWSDLLRNAIEQEMRLDPVVIKNRLQNNKDERERLLKDLEGAKNRQENKKQIERGVELI